jgi:oligogalacturonide lyase
MDPTCECLTPDSPGNNQLPYFTSPGLTADGRILVLISDRSGDPNLVARDLASGREWMLTDNRHGWMRSYVYFDGRPGEGFGRASVSLDPVRGVVYHLQGRELRAVGLDGGSRILATLPDDQVTAFTHVSANGRFVCVPTTSARAIEGPLSKGRPEHDVDARVQAEGLSSWLRVFDTASGALVACTEVPHAWITHVQFAPDGDGTILYNHEWPGDCGIRRMWLWDGNTHRRLRDEGRGRSRRDWTCHEMWADGGTSVIYHGKFADGLAYIGRWSRLDGTLTEVALPAGWQRYGHFTADYDGGLLVSDGYYQAEGDPEMRYGAWLSLQRVEWSHGTISWTPLCRHGSSWRSQDEHPHPLFSPDRRHILFTSDVGGRRAAWRVAVPAKV